MDPVSDEDQPPQMKRGASGVNLASQKDAANARFESTLRRIKAVAPPAAEARLKTMRTFALARVAESLRFDIEDDEMDAIVTKDLLARVLRRANSTRIHAPEDALNEEIDKLWVAVERIGDLGATFNDLLDIECPNFPETTPAQREALKSIAMNTDVVSKSALCRQLGVTAKSQLVEFIFASGAEVIPGEVFKDIVGTLESHPFSLPFCMSFTQQTVDSGRKMMTLLPFLVMIFVTLGIIPFVTNMDYYVMMRSVHDVMDDEWENGCPHGPTSPRGCKFIMYRFNVMKTIEDHVMRYFREALITKFWPEEGESAAMHPVGFDPSMGSTFFVGALLLRLTADTAAKITPTWTCEDLNLTLATTDSRVYAEYGCDAIWAAVIPFNVTQEEALERASTVTTVLPRLANAALMAQFGTYEPSTGLAAYFKIIVSLPQGGHMMTRLTAYPVDYEAHRYVLPLLVINVILFALSLLFAVFYATKGQKLLNSDLVFDFTLMILISYSYHLLRTLPPIDLYQVEYINPQHDEAAAQFTLATRVLAFWVMLIIGLVARYLQEVGALYVVIAILRHAALEIFALVVIFTIWTLSFALVASLFFGTVASEFASAFSSFNFLFAFFSDGGSYEKLVESHQILGPLFWFFFSIFVIFLALNLLIAVLTAPLQEVKETCDLHIIMQAKVAMEIQLDSARTPLQRKLEQLRELLLPFINLLFDSSPSPSFKLFFLSLNNALKALCTIHVHNDPVQSINGARQLLELLNNESAAVPFDTRLANMTFKSGDLDEYSLAFTLQAIASMSSVDIVRDARLEKALMLYDIHTANTKKLQEKQEVSRAEAAKLSTSLECESSISCSFDMENTAREGRSMSTEATPRAAAAAQTAEVDPNPLQGPPVVAEGASMDVADEDDTDELQSARFAFTKFLLKRLRRARLFGIQFIVLLTVFSWYFGTGLTRDTSSGYLVDSIEQGLVHYPNFQTCFDENCTDTMSYPKAFVDTDNREEWEEWMELTFIRQMFVEEELGFGKGGQPYAAVENRSGVTGWDRRITFDLPIHFRQLQAEEQECHLPENMVLSGGETSVARRKFLLDNFACTKLHEFRERDMEPIPDLDPLLSPEIFKHRTSCAERRGIAFWGRYQMLYPCSGFIAEIYSKKQLEALVNSGWVNNKTRLLSATVTYRSGETVVEHTLYWGFGGGGATVETGFLATPLSEDSTQLEVMLIVVMVCLSMDAIIEFGTLIYQQLAGKNQVDIKISELLPTHLIFVYVSVLVLPYIIYRDPAVNERVKLQLAVATMSLTYMASNVVLFPIAGLFSKQATLLFETLGRSARQIALIVPFYIIFIASFAYSGLLIFSSRVPEFSSIRFALLTISRGALGDFDTESMYHAMPEIAELYNIIYYAVVLIMLANLVLAMVTSAAGDALETPLSVELGERVCQAFSWHVMYGSLIEFFIAWNVFFLRKSPRSAEFSCRSMSTIATGDGNRLPYLTETLCAIIGPNRANDILRQLRVDAVSEKLFPSMIMMILEQHQKFEAVHRIDEAIDDELEREMIMKHYSPGTSFATQEHQVSATEATQRAMASDVDTIVS